MKLKAAIIGAGSAGREQARRMKLLEAVELAAAVDVHVSAADQLCRAFGGRSFKSVGAMVETVRPDFVVVTTPNHAHARNVTDAADAGVRNIFCEKPLSVEMADAARIADLAERLGIRTSMGFTGEHPGITHVMSQAKAGELGEIRSVFFHIFRGYGFWGQERINAAGLRAHHAAVAHPNCSGGWAMHHACHPVFVLTELGGMVHSVFGSLAASTPACPSEEIVNATLLFDNQITGTIVDSIGSYRGLHFGVIGTRATSMFHDQFYKRKDDAIVVRTHREGQTDACPTTLHYDQDGSNRLKEFVEAILADAPSPITFRQGLENLRLCHAIGESSRTGRVVRIEPSAQPSPAGHLVM